MSNPVQCRYCGTTIDRPEYTPAPHDAHGVCIIEQGRTDEAEARRAEEAGLPMLAEAIRERHTMRDTDYIPAATVEEIGRQEDILYERMITLARAARRSRTAKREYERVRAAYLKASDLREYLEAGGR